MLTLILLVLFLAMVPSLVYAALFPSNSMVKMLDEKGFRKAMKANVSRVGFLLGQGVLTFGLLANGCGCVCCALVWCM